MNFSAKKTKRLIVFLSILLSVIFSLHQTAFSKTKHVCKNANFLKSECLKEKGTWLEKYNECENMPQKTCEKLGGVYNECASPCRHMKVDACIALCQPVCSFSKVIKR